MSKKIILSSVFSTGNKGKELDTNELIAEQGGRKLSKVYGRVGLVNSILEGFCDETHGKGGKKKSSDIFIFFFF